MIVSVLLLLLSLNYVFVFTYVHQKFLVLEFVVLHKTLWSERCKKHDVALNDCNWCWCDNKQRYSCNARVCSEVDMFGHFKDAIQPIDVGMEGHGVWRSKPSSCSPGVQYRRGDMLCVCNEEGHWPNPVCRDALRVLHAVEVTELTQPSENYTCFPNKLYLVGCNVCFCATGNLNPKLCTNTTCYKNDAVNSNETKEKNHVENENDLEVYATCQPNVMYTLGCMSCKCLRNNRLVCQPCAKEKELKELQVDTTCTGSSEIFQVGCNLCYCDRESRKICTVRNCVAENLTALKDDIQLDDKSVFKSAPTPIDYEDCKPGTSFKNDCNICRCTGSGGKKTIQCTVKICDKSDNMMRIKQDCVLGTAYEWKCMTCFCEERNGVKVQTCVTNKACTVKARQLNTDVKSLNGYCEPLHVYTDDCNKCRCLADGEILVCTSKICKSKAKPVSVEIVPVKLRTRDRCPRGRSFTLNCNMCFCLNNGNSMCTTSDCGRAKNTYPVIQ